MELTLQVLSTGDKVKRGREKTEWRGWRKDEDDVVEKGGREECMETRRTKWRGIDGGQYIDLLTY